MTADTIFLPGEVISRVAQPLQRLPACIAGSAVAAETYGMASAYHDIDVFCYSPEALVSAAERLLKEGLTLKDRDHRVYQRWLRFGMDRWHTNSLHLLDDIDGTEVNLVFKTSKRNPLSSLSQVLESFDFGLLGVGYDLELGVKQDLRGYLFPGHDIDGPLPLMPQRRNDWRNGFISQYQGLRELGRYAKYLRYGYDLSLVQDDLVEGYMAAATYLGGRSEPEKQTLSQIYFVAAEKITLGDIDDLEAAGKQLVVLDSLDEIMEALE